MVSSSTSSLYAAAVMLRGQAITDLELASAIEVPTRLLAQESTSAGFDAAMTLAQLVPLSATVDNNRQLAETAIRKLAGLGAIDNEFVGRLAGTISELENAFVHCRPDAIADLETRGKLLRQQWESRGPGLLAAMARLTETGLLAECASVVLVHPVLGGGGVPYMRHNLAVIEAMLTNPHAELPETVRLGWLLSTLNLDLPIYSDVVPGDRLPLVGMLAMLPVVLAASEQVEWCRLDVDTIELAIGHWHIPIPESAIVASLLMRWWEMYQTAQPRWSVALAALDQTLSEKHDWSVERS